VLAFYSMNNFAVFANLEPNPASDISLSSTIVVIVVDASPCRLGCERLALSKMECLRATDMGQSCSLCFNRKPTALTGGHILHACETSPKVCPIYFRRTKKELIVIESCSSCWYRSSLIKKHIYIKKVNNFFK
jgi:hypothetical protein